MASQFLSGAVSQSVDEIRQSDTQCPLEVGTLQTVNYPAPTTPEAPTLSLAATQALLAEVGNDPLQFVLALTRRYGDAVRYETPCGSAYLFNHPEAIGRVFTHHNYRRAKSYPLKMMLGEGVLTAEGAQWRHHRRLMQPEFHQQRIAALGDMIARTTAEMLQRWDTGAMEGREFDMTPEMLRLTLNIAVRGLLGEDLEADVAGLNEALVTLTNGIGDYINIQFAVPLHFSAARNREFRTALQHVRSVVREIVRQRRGEEPGRHDLLSLLLGETVGREGQPLSEVQLQDEILTMLFAGSDSSARMLTWLWHLLDAHPAVEARLAAEGARVLQGQLPTSADAAQLSFTRAALEETLRLYPPVWALFRQVGQDDVVGGYRVQASAAAIISAYAIQRDSRYWVQPDAFVPERFLPGAPQPARYTYFPFGFGQHLCMGNHLALLEGQLAVATILQKYRLRIVENAPPVPLAGLTLRPQQVSRVRLEPRASADNPSRDAASQEVL